jgi:hypothetical protein
MEFFDFDFPFSDELRPQDASESTTGDFGFLPPDPNSVPDSASPPHFKKPKWSLPEDELLKQSVAKYGVRNWNAVSQEVPHRTGKQCRERWVNQLSPILQHETWTPEEDLLLIQQQRIFGNGWTQIAASLPGRSPNSIKNRWNWMCRRPMFPLLAKQMLAVLEKSKNPPHNSEQPPPIERAVGTISESDKYHVTPIHDRLEREIEESEGEIERFEGWPF